MLIDNELTVIGTTNFTSRSFNINDEMNLYIHGGTIVSEVNEALAKIFMIQRNDERVFEVIFWERCKEKFAGWIDFYL